MADIKAAVKMAEEKAREAQSAEARKFYFGVMVGLTVAEMNPEKIEAELKEAAEKRQQAEGKDAETAMFFAGVVQGLWDAKKMLALA